jgi:hypothetical protein
MGLTSSSRADPPESKDDGNATELPVPLVMVRPPEKPAARPPLPRPSLLYVDSSSRRLVPLDRCWLPEALRERLSEVVAWASRRSRPFGFEQFYALQAVVHCVLASPVGAMTVASFRQWDGVVHACWPHGPVALPDGRAGPHWTPFFHVPLLELAGDEASLVGLFSRLVPGSCHLVRPLPRSADGSFLLSASDGKKHSWPMASEDRRACSSALAVHAMSSLHGVDAVKTRTVLSPATGDLSPVPRVRAFGPGGSSLGARDSLACSVCSLSDVLPLDSIASPPPGVVALARPRAVEGGVLECVDWPSSIRIHSESYDLVAFVVRGRDVLESSEPLFITYLRGASWAYDGRSTLPLSSPLMQWWALASGGSPVAVTGDAPTCIPKALAEVAVYAQSTPVVAAHLKLAQRVRDLEIELEAGMADLEQSVDTGFVEASPLDGCSRLDERSWFCHQTLTGLCRPGLVAHNLANGFTCHPSLAQGVGTTWLIREAEVLRRESLPSAAAEELVSPLEFEVSAPSSITLQDDSAPSTPRHQVESSVPRAPSPVYTPDSVSRMDAARRASHVISSARSPLGEGSPRLTPSNDLLRRTLTRHHQHGVPSPLRVDVSSSVSSVPSGVSSPVMVAHEALMASSMREMLNAVKTELLPPTETVLEYQGVEATAKALCSVGKAALSVAADCRRERIMEEEKRRLEEEARRKAEKKRQEEEAEKKRRAAAQEAARANPDVDLPAEAEVDVPEEVEGRQTAWKNHLIQAGTELMDLRRRMQKSVETVPRDVKRGLRLMLKRGSDCHTRRECLHILGSKYAELQHLRSNPVYDLFLLTAAKEACSLLTQCDSDGVAAADESMLAETYNVGLMISQASLLIPGLWDAFYTRVSEDCAAVGPRLLGPGGRAKAVEEGSHKLLISGVVAALAGGAAMSCGAELRATSFAMWRDIVPMPDPFPVPPRHEPSKAMRLACPLRCLDGGAAEVDSRDFGEMLWTWLARCLNLCNKSSVDQTHPLVPFTVACILRMGGWALSLRFGGAFIKLLQSAGKSLELIESASQDPDAGRKYRESVRSSIEQLVGFVGDRPGSAFRSETNRRPAGWSGIPAEPSVGMVAEGGDDGQGYE